jgi:hypothetical protein
MLVLAVCQTTLHYNDLYDVRFVADMRDLMVRLLQAIGFASILLAVIYYWGPDAIIGRGVFLFASIFMNRGGRGLAARVLLGEQTCRTSRAAAAVRHGAAAIELARELHQRRRSWASISSASSTRIRRASEPRSSTLVSSAPSTTSPLWSRR